MSTADSTLEIGDPLESARFVMQRARSASIDDGAIERWALAWRGADRAAHASPLDDVAGSRDEIANLVLLIDCLNFCFWSPRVIACDWRGRRVERYLAFAAAIARAVTDDCRWLDAAFWGDMTRARFDAILPPHGELLLCDERVAVLRETGGALQARFGGRFASVVDAAGDDAAGLARMLARGFASFRDAADYDGRTIWLLKRAQICAIDLDQAWRSRGFAGLDGVERLTAFADYRLPQALRRSGIVRVSPALAGRIERREELPAASADEVELRAASIEAVERMRQALSAAGRTAAAWEIDFDLWARSHDTDVRIEHHRTRTIYY